MPLTQLSVEAAWGGHEIRSWTPAIQDFDDVYYLPFGFRTSWGIFDANDNIVGPSVDYAHPDNRVQCRQVLKSNRRFADIGNALDDGVYLYGGRLRSHFGHFILETLSRLWPLIDGKPPGLKIVMHGEFAPDQYFEKYPFMKQAYAALNIGLEDIVYSDRPFRMKRLTVSNPSLQAQSFGHTVFANLCHAIGANLMAGNTKGAKARPVYLSKSQLSQGVTRVVNEQELEYVLARNGVDIIYPEQLTLVEQIKIFANREVVAGTPGSFFHASIFTPTPGRLEVLGGSTSINSNYFLIDALNKNDARYYFAEHSSELKNEQSSFQVETRFSNPTELGKEFAEILWSKRPAPATGIRRSLLSAVGFRRR